MPTPIQPNRLDPPLVDPLREKILGDQPGVASDPLVPAGNHPYPGKENISLSGYRSHGLLEAERNDHQISQGLVGFALRGISQAERVLEQVSQKWTGGEPGAEELQPLAMRIIEIASKSYSGVSPLDSEKPILTGDGTRIPAFKLVGDGGSALIEFSALLPGEQAPQHLSVARENLSWAKQELLKTQQEIDQRKLKDLQQQTLDRGVESLPPIPARITEGIHSGILPSRVADLLA